MVERLVNEFGSPLAENSSRRTFPTPAQIAEVHPDLLRSLIRLGYRAPYVHELGTRIASGELDYDFIPIDSWALKVVSREWYQGEPVRPTEVKAAFERWGEWKGLAFSLWDWSIHED